MIQQVAANSAYVQSRFAIAFGDTVASVSEHCRVGERAMRILCCIAALLCFNGINSRRAHGDGLLHRLPEDGSWVQFDKEVTRTLSGRTSTSNGHLTLSLVGRTQVNGEQCQWIEMTVTENQSTYRDKFLVPQKYLKSGEAPAEHVLRWLNAVNHENPQHLDPALVGIPLPAAMYFSGPGFPDDRMKLEKEIVESKLGKLQCAGLTGRTRWTDGNAEVWDMTYRTRIHSKAPFGVVEYRLEFKRTDEGNEKMTGRIVLRLADFGTAAQSAFSRQR